VALALISTVSNNKNNRLSSHPSWNTPEQPDKKTSSSSLFPGTMLALHQWKHETNILAKTAPLLLTRCKQLDEMIALPTEYCAVTSTNNKTTTTAFATRTGMSFGQILQISGPPGTAKTQLAFQLACSPGLEETWYICSSSPNLTRLWDISHQSGRVLQRTKCTMATDEFQLLSRLAEFEASIERRTTSWKPLLLVIDSCSECMSSENSEFVVMIGQTIRRLTRQYMLATILINGTVSNHHRKVGKTATASTTMTTIHDGEPSSSFRSHKPALGRAWRAVSDIHIWLEQEKEEDATSNSRSGSTEIRHPPNNVRIRCYLDSHASKRPDQNSSVGVFTVTPQGIQDVSTG
jgi:hypothetical protein